MTAEANDEDRAQASAGTETEANAGSGAWKYCPVCGNALAGALLGGLPRQLCAVGCGFVHWDNPAPVVAALVEIDGHVVLARNQAWTPGAFGLITGFLEREEDPAQAVLREVKEELDLDADAATLIGVYPFARKNEVLIAYHVAARGAIRLNEELAEFRLVAPDLLKAWDYGTGLAVADWLARRQGRPGRLERLP